MTSVRLALNPEVAGLRRVFCCHSAALSHRWPPNSIEAVEECISHDVPRLEVDVRFMADDSMVIFHDGELAPATTGEGRVADLRPKDLAGIRYRSDESVGLCFLQDVVERMAGSDTLLQVDLKLMRPITRERAGLLVSALAPLGDRVLVGSQAHWNLRLLTGVPIAFDPSLHWRHGPEGAEARPRSLGRYGLWDDSPVATNSLFETADYLDARVRDLLALVPGAVEWMVDMETIRHVGRLGLALGDRLRTAGCSLAAWTLHGDTPDREACLAELFQLGVTTVITDAPLTVAGVSLPESSVNRL